MPAETKAPVAPPPAAPPPEPAPAPAPAPAAPPPEENPFAEIDAKIKLADAPRPTTKGKDQDAQPAVPPPAPAAQAKPAATPPGAKAEGSKAPADLRKELERLKGELSQRNEAYSAMEKRIAEAERKGKDTSALTERLQTMEKEIEKRDAELRALKQEASPEFKKRFDQPFNEAAEFAKRTIEQLVVTTEDGNTRQATWDDFAAIYSLPLNKASAAARQMFGDDAQTVINHLNELHRLNYVRGKALEEERAQWKEKSAAEEANRVAAHQKMVEAWNKVNSDLAEKDEDYHDSPEDKEAEALRKQAISIIDAPMKNDVERLIRNAHIRQRAAAFPVLKLKILRLQAELEKAKADLEKSKPVTPGKQKRPTSEEIITEPESWEEAARKAMA